MLPIADLNLWEMFSWILKMSKWLLEYFKKNDKSLAILLCCLSPEDRSFSAFKHSVCSSGAPADVTLSVSSSSISSRGRSKWLSCCHTLVILHSWFSDSAVIDCVPCFCQPSSLLTCRSIRANRRPHTWRKACCQFNRERLIYVRWSPFGGPRSVHGVTAAWGITHVGGEVWFFVAWTKAPVYPSGAHV